MPFLVKSKCGVTRMREPTTKGEIKSTDPMRVLDGSRWVPFLYLPAGMVGPPGDVHIEVKECGQDEYDRLIAPTKTTQGKPKKGKK